MPKQLFTEKWNHIYPLSTPLKEVLQKHLSVQNIRKGQALYHQDERLHKIYFIAKGLIVGHRLERHQKSVCWFLKEDEFIKDHDSLLYQKTAKHTAIATESSVLVTLSYQDLQVINRDFSEANVVAKHQLASYLRYQQHRITLLTIYNSNERYHRFVQDFPWTIGRLKRGDIASFLNMTPETLSRMR